MYNTRNLIFLTSSVSPLLILAGRSNDNSKSSLAKRLTEAVKTGQGAFLKEFSKIPMRNLLQVEKTHKLTKLFLPIFIMQKHNDINYMLPTITNSATYFPIAFGNWMVNNAEGILLKTFCAIQILKRFPIDYAALSIIWSFLVHHFYKCRVMLHKKYYHSQAVGHFYGSTYLNAYFTTNEPTSRIE
ncbi:hypothetical protein T4A_1189 [Trichinella pseudospiralis]|uniref:Uncharacterized protein n=1 Tax=Trichinella pseudospiralis TaxID=6337 RepID=A0A0V1E1N3_TRIPS|nr:hypothetical protein T4A_1189 [Trichinella pseudospiralis]